MDMQSTVTTIAASGTFEIIRIFIVSIVVILLATVGVLAIRPIWKLDEGIRTMKNAHKKSFPDDELPPVLKEAASGSDRWNNLHVSWILEGNALDFLLDVEEEKTYPYYRRTRQVLSDTHEKSSAELADGSWYDYEEWVRDMIAGKAKVTGDSTQNAVDK